jgi:hypothetical protein
VSDGVADDVGDVIVDELIGDFGRPSRGRDQPDLAEHLEVLGQQRLADLASRATQGVGELVHATRACSQLQDDGESDR